MSLVEPWRSTSWPGALLLGVAMTVGCGDKSDRDDGSDDSGGAAVDSGDAGGGDDGGGGPGGVSAEDFVTAYAQAICGWAQECGALQAFGGTYAACIDLVAGQVSPGLSDCGYDPVAAAECLSALERSSCDGGGEDPACEAVCSDGW